MPVISSLNPRGRLVERDPKRTRERILAAALREFPAKGFAGTRVDGIAPTPAS